ncbi:MAG: hypothetical protein M1820_007621 [Bogoriella megaspora]|nr:MAG: hypothetical protein M1820_007621 [Bogoriella megaspora]
MKSAAAEEAVASRGTPAVIRRFDTNASALADIGLSSFTKSRKAQKYQILYLVGLGVPFTARFQRMSLRQQREIISATSFYQWYDIPVPAPYPALNLNTWDHLFRHGYLNSPSFNPVLHRPNYGFMWSDEYWTVPTVLPMIFIPSPAHKIALSSESGLSFWDRERLERMGLPLLSKKAAPKVQERNWEGRSVADRLGLTTLTVETWHKLFEVGAECWCGGKNFELWLKQIDY